MRCGIFSACLWNGILPRMVLARPLLGHHALAMFMRNLSTETSPRNIPRSDPCTLNLGLGFPSSRGPSKSSVGFRRFFAKRSQRDLVLTWHITLPVWSPAPLFYCRGFLYRTSNYIQDPDKAGKVFGKTFPEKIKPCSFHSFDSPARALDFIERHPVSAGRFWSASS